MSALSKLELINLCLGRAGSDALPALESVSTTEGKQALLFFDDRFCQLVSKFPWPFITKRVLLDQVQGKTQRFQYKYRIPNDVLYIWDIYPDKRNARIYPSSWDLTYIPYELYENFNFFGDTENYEIIDNHIESSYTRVYLHYTTANEVPIETANQQFLSILKHEITNDLLRAKGVDTERLALEDSNAEKVRQDSFGRQSIENRKSVSLPRAKIMTKLDYYS